MPDNPQMPEELERLANQPRVQIRRQGAPRKGGRCVVYWMQRAMRIADNAALDVAIEAGNLLGLPVVVFFSVIPNYPNANLRHYHFMAQGLRDVAEDAAERGVGFVVRRPQENSLAAFLEEVEAALVVGDENPCREPERWRKVLARKLRLPYWTVDADVVVPSAVFNRSFVLLHHFRPHLKEQLPRYLLAPPKTAPLTPWKPWKALPGFSLEQDITAGFSKLDRRVGPVDSFTGGTHAALKRLGEFIRLDLKAYEETRNHPELRGTSRLSPYLHFGNIGPLTIAMAVEKAVKQGKASASARDRFLEQLIGWRELAVLFVRHAVGQEDADRARRRPAPAPLQPGRTGTRGNRRRSVERGPAGAGGDGLDARLYADVLGEEDSGMGAGPGQGLRVGGRDERSLRAGRARPERLCGHCMGHRGQARPAMVQPAGLRTGAVHDRSLDGEEVRCGTVYSAERQQNKLSWQPLCISSSQPFRFWAIIRTNSNPGSCVFHTSDSSGI
jgi:hypothetical protein